MTANLSLLTSQNALLFLNAFAGNPLEGTMTIPLGGSNTYDVRAPFDSGKAVQLLEMDSQFRREGRQIILCTELAKFRDGHSVEPVTFVPHTQSQWAISYHDSPSYLQCLGMASSSSASWNKILLGPAIDRADHDKGMSRIDLSKENYGRSVKMRLTYHGDSRIAAEQPSFEYGISAHGPQLASLIYYLGLQQDDAPEVMLDQFATYLGLSKVSIINSDDYTPPRATGKRDNVGVRITYEPVHIRFPDELVMRLYKEDGRIFRLPKFVNLLWNWDGMR